MQLPVLLDPYKHECKMDSSKDCYTTPATMGDVQETSNIYTPHRADDTHPHSSSRDTSSNPHSAEYAPEAHEETSSSSSPDVSPQTINGLVSTRCRLLQLPAELRLRIYEYTYAGTRLLCAPVEIGEAFVFSSRRTAGDGGTTALLRTCQQVLHEAQPVLYKQLNFTICIASHMNERLGEFFDGYQPMKDTSSIAPLMCDVEIELSACHGWPSDIFDNVRELRFMVNHFAFSMNGAKLDISKAYMFLKDDSSTRDWVGWRGEVLLREVETLAMRPFDSSNLQERVAQEMFSGIFHHYASWYTEREGEDRKLPPVSAR
jgi:hypothetical protein